MCFKCLAFNSSSIAGSVTVARLWVEWSTNPGYAPANYVQWALAGGTLASTGIYPTDVVNEVTETYDLYAQGVDTLEEISTLEIEYLDTDGNKDWSAFDYVFVEVTTVPVGL